MARAEHTTTGGCSPASVLSTIEAIDEVMLQEIFLFVGRQDLTTVASVCRKWDAVVKSTSFLARLPKPRTVADFKALGKDFLIKAGGARIKSRYPTFDPSYFQYVSVRLTYQHNVKDVRRVKSQHNVKDDQDVNNVEVKFENKPEFIPLQHDKKGWTSASTNLKKKIRLRYGTLRINGSDDERSNQLVSINQRREPTTYPIRDGRRREKGNELGLV